MVKRLTSCPRPVEELAVQPACSEAVSRKQCPPASGDIAHVWFQICWCKGALYPFLQKGTCMMCKIRDICIMQYQSMMFPGVFLSYR